MSEAWEVDAAQTGEIDRNRKPYLAMRAARCVELSENQAHVKSDMKVSAQKFAEAAGMSTNTIKSYIAIYDECVNLHPDEYEKRANMVPLHEYPFPSAEHWKEARQTITGSAGDKATDDAAADRGRPGYLAVYEEAGKAIRKFRSINPTSLTDAERNQAVSVMRELMDDLRMTAETYDAAGSR